MRVRTVVGPEGIVARATFKTTNLKWDELDGLRFPKRGWARARLTDGSEVALPVVTFGRLPQLSEASGGRIPDPYAAAQRAEEKAHREEAAAEAGSDAETTDDAVTVEKKDDRSS